MAKNGIRTRKVARLIEVRFIERFYKGEIHFYTYRAEYIFDIKEKL
jgi:hypothetical protein